MVSALAIDAYKKAFFKQVGGIREATLSRRKLNYDVDWYWYLIHFTRFETWRKPCVHTAHELVSIFLGT